MMKKFKKGFSLVLTGAMAVSLLAMAGCDNGSEGSGSFKGVDEKVTIGVLVADDTGAEALSFRAYYEEYLQEQYNVEFMYSEKLENAEQEVSAIESFATTGCEAVISFASADRNTQIEMCEESQMYYAVATGVLKEDDFNAYKEYEYFVGSTGPSTNIEFEAGYDMAKYFIEEGDDNFLLYGGAANFGDEMHVYRIAGMLAAMCEADPDASYDGATEKADLAAAVTKNGGVDASKWSSDKFEVDYIGGFPDGDAFFANIAQKMGASGLQTLLAVDLAVEFFGGFTDGNDVKLAQCGSYVESMKEPMESGMVTYLAGKFSACNAPIFVAVLNAVNGKGIRDNGCAFSVEQGYWVATDAETFNKYYDVCSSTTDPVYTKEILDKYLATDEEVTFDEFKAFVNAYTFDEISAL